MIRPAAIVVSLVAAAVAPAGAQTVNIDIRAQVMPRESTTLAAEVGARISALTIREGDRFARGRVLIEFDCSTQEAQLDEAQAALVATEATVAVNKRLLATQTIGRLESEVALAEAAKARAKVKAAAAVMAKCSIAAPFDGRVVEQKAHAQQFVQPGQALLEILDDSVLEVEFVVPSSALMGMIVGRTLQVVLEETAKVYDVRISRVGARIDPVSQTVKVAAIFPERHPELVVGMSGHVVMDAK